ncbi:hypothetical protein LSAT2_018538 [Lamellibrachia satsuma]|nr:hypothetical protein LSAT2_018538 [Lamellibrachia satsuma]
MHHLDKRVDDLEQQRLPQQDNEEFVRTVVAQNSRAERHLGLANTGFFLARTVRSASSEGASEAIRTKKYTPSFAGHHKNVLSRIDQYADVLPSLSRNDCQKDVTINKSQETTMRCHQKYVLLLCFFVASVVIDEAVACRRKCSSYNHDTHICCRGRVQSKEGEKNKTACCGKKAYNRKYGICCWGSLHDHPGYIMRCCGMRPYTPLMYRCCPRFRVVHIAAMCPRY